MLLKLGSTGEYVKNLQRFLGLNPDGEFGPLTEQAVKNYQLKKGLFVDGIVGPKTMNDMGLLDTDATEVTIPPHLNMKRKWLNKDEYRTSNHKKEWIFLHHTAGWENPYQTIDGWELDTRGTVGTEFVLGGSSIYNNNNKFDGELVEAFPQGGYAWHLTIGDNEMHRNSVGIEVCNFGFLEKGGYHKVINKVNTWIPLKSDKFYTYVGTEVHPDQITELKEPYRGFKFWHKYSDLQISKLKDWILWIADRDDIDPRKGLVELIKKEGGFKGFNKCDVNMCINQKGLWLHSNVILGKNDLYPQPNLIEMLLNL